MGGGFCGSAVSYQLSARSRGSAGEDGGTIDVEDCAGDEAGERSAEEEDGAGDLRDVGGALRRDGGVGASGDGGIIEDGGGHLRVGPAGCDAVGVDSVRGEFGGERLGEGDDGTLGGGVVGVKAFAALAGRGGDEDDVAASGGRGGIGRAERGADRRGRGTSEHVGGGGGNQAEDAIEIGGDGAVPLGSGHGGDGGGGGRPDVVVGDEDGQGAEGREGVGYEGSAILWRFQRLLDG